MTVSDSVVFLITGLNRGGAEAQLLLLARELVSRGWKVTVVCLISGGPLRSEFEDLGCEVRSLGMRRGFPDPRGVLRLTRILRRVRPAILHSHMVHANLLARICRLLAPVPVLISTAHSISEGGRWRELAYRLTDPLADLTTIISNAAAERYVQVGAVPSHKLKMVPNGVSLEQFGRNESVRASLRKSLALGDKFVWLAVGRLDVPKDYSNMLNAVSRLSSDSMLLIAGDGPLRSSTLQLAAELGLSKRVRFLGLRDDVAKLMAGADAYVMSSAWEGLPMVLLEAAASSVPIVATDVGGNREIVCDGVNGFLVPGKDSAALANAMTAMEQLSDESRRGLGVAGRAHVSRRYSLSAVVDEWEAIYRSLLEKQYDRRFWERPVASA
jgi:glycosyltransferase involved in cell wall biosynthesis